ncbi:Thioredoxin-like fold protein [Cordyceps fumosorosea ARSEF 2679]|uniref:protein disulfide-isomerase n=1 Tax=Cordyceps fumosorosea (strain ARSEF 2679) TaxID=1081104 RepID=A0A167N6G1_CORFA|nr:Thioredoxin-like fold protein [Cordyceps fumosorosea ARSEF 2679]OAA55186.1 Thioredoxin-like fold protein [Cordyceps fumosorosea ARSEF 2679]
MHQHTVASALAVLLATAPTAWAGMYTKKSPVLQVDAKSFDRLINRSNYTSIVEFYAPWCGHCQNLKPAYEKAATNLQGLAKVAAVDCDEDANKQLCGSMGVKGFPTLKIVRPGKKAGRPVVEDYNGGRTAGAIVEAVAAKINNHVARLADKDLEGFLAGGDGPKAILFTEKGTTSALLRSIAIDYLGVVGVAQIRSKEAKAVARFGIDKFPTLVLVPGGGGEPVVYDGEMKKADMVKFLSQAGEPNPDPAPAKSKGGDKKDKKAKADKKEKPKAADESSKAQQKKAAAEQDAEAEAETDNEAPPPPPVSTPQIIVIPTASSKQEVSEQCLQPKSHTCILALVPEAETDDSKKVIDSLSQLNTKYIHGQRKVFPFIAVPDSVAVTIREKLEATSEVELVAVNARRNWWRRYEGDFAAASVEAWVDVIRMGEGAKKKLPKGIVEDSEEPAEKIAEEPKEEKIIEEPKEEIVEEAVEEEQPVVEEEAEPEEAAEVHDEL